MYVHTHIEYKVHHIGSPIHALKQCDNLAFVICKFLYITPKMNALVHRTIMEQDMHKPNSLVIAL